MTRPPVLAPWLARGAMPSRPSSLHVHFLFLIYTLFGYSVGCTQR